MKPDVHEALASEFDEHRIGRKLHDVPPHEVYEVRADGRRAVCKRDVGPTGTAATEGAVTAFVGERTSVPVPEVLAVGEGYYVARWHPDAPEPDEGGAADREWARAAGRALATLHAETAPHVDGYGRFRRRGDDLAVDGRDSWGAAAADYVRRRRPILAEHGHADVADAALDALDGHPDAFAGAGEPACIHGWATPDHVAVTGGEVRCMLDFEHAMAAPGEFDYWRTVLPAFGGEGAARRAFREGYEAVRPLPDGVERRRPAYVLLCGIYYFESLYVQDQHGPRETARRADRLRERVLGAIGGLP